MKHKQEADRVDAMVPDMQNVEMKRNLPWWMLLQQQTLIVKGNSLHFFFLCVFEQTNSTSLEKVVVETSAENLLFMFIQIESDFWYFLCVMEMSQALHGLEKSRKINKQPKVVAHGATIVVCVISSVWWRWVATPLMCETYQGCAAHFNWLIRQWTKSKRESWDSNIIPRHG